MNEVTSLYERLTNIESHISVPTWKSTKEFMWRHKYKIISGAGVIGAALWYYDWLPGSEKREDGEREGAKGRNAGLRSRQLLRARKHFDLAMADLLPVLRLKIAGIVEDNTAIKQIRELRASGTGVDTILSEEQLWDEIKISSFSLLFVTIYSSSLVICLSRLLCHLLARKSPSGVSNSPSSSNTSTTTTTTTTTTVSSNNNNTIDAQDFKVLIEKLLSHIYNDGLEHLASLVRNQVSHHMTEWRVCLSCCIIIYRYRFCNNNNNMLMFISYKYQK
jgi:hypothetical protein